MVFDPEFFHRLSHMTLSPRIRPNLGNTGAYKSGKKGSSIEFSDIREYLAGDDIRRIDWNAYARSEKLFVKLFMDEREARYHILLDTSRSMDLPEEKSKKALQIAAMLAYLAFHNGDRADVTFLKEQNSYTTKSYTGKNALYPLLNELTKTQFTGSISLETAIRPLSFYGKGTTFLISDFLSPWTQDDIEKQLDITTLLYLLQNQKQAVVLIQISSPEEEHPELLFSENTTEHLMTLVDSETNGKLKITPSKTLFQQYYQRKLSFEQQLFKAASRCQSIYIKSISKDPIEQFLFDGQKKGLWK